MSADLIKALRFHGRFGAETEEEARGRKYREREQAATELEQQQATIDRLAGELQAIRAGHTVTVEINLSGVEKDAAIRAKLIELGWTPPPEKPLAYGHREDYYLMANARMLAERPIAEVKAMPNWVFAKHLFATGGTSAPQICIDAGIDPDATTISRR